jgi:hypothetical protein
VDKRLEDVAFALECTDQVFRSDTHNFLP